jgi:hypothetical protein
MPNSLSEVLAAIPPFDPADLTATAGGLQLLPENADHIVRLEALAHASASVAPSKSAKKISAPRLRALLNNMLYRLFGPLATCIRPKTPYYLLWRKWQVGTKLGTLQKWLKSSC